MLAQLRSLPALDAVLSSPLQRCAGPAETFAREQNLPFESLPEVAEIDFGDWEGRAVSEIESESPAAIHAFWRDAVNHSPPQAESLPDFQRRIAAAWRQLLAAHEGQQLVLVTHGGVIRMILAELLAMPLRPLSHLHVPHGCLSLLRYFHAPDQPVWPQLIFHNARAQDDH